MDTQQYEKQNLSKDGGTPCEPTAIHVKRPTVSADVVLQLGYFLLGGWWQDLHSGHSKNPSFDKTFQKHKKRFENPLRGSTSCQGCYNPCC